MPELVIGSRVSDFRHGPAARCEESNGQVEVVLFHREMGEHPGGERDLVRLRLARRKDAFHADTRLEPAEPLRRQERGTGQPGEYQGPSEYSRSPYHRHRTFLPRIAFEVLVRARAADSSSLPPSGIVGW